MFKKEKIPEGIRILTWSTSVRWFGWGLGEAFVPIFLLSFSENFSETGLLASIYNITFFLSIPFAGYLADNIKIRSMILAGLIIYIFIGLGYFLAGATGAIIFKVFGKFDVITNFWWIIAVIIGLLLVKFAFLPIHWLLFFITPTSIISFLIVLRLKEGERNHNKGILFLKVYSNLFRDIKNFSTGLKFILVLTFITGILSSVIYFFIPVFAYLNGDGLVNSTILALVYAMPILFGKILGKIADEKRENIYFISFSFVVLILVSLMFTKNYFLLLIIMFLSSAIFELISLTNKGMIARFADRTHLGEIDGSLNGVSAVGAVVGPLLFGFLLDSISQPNAYLFIVSISAVALLVSFWGTKKCFQVR